MVKKILTFCKNNIHFVLGFVLIVFIIMLLVFLGKKLAFMIITFLGGLGIVFGIDKLKSDNDKKEKEFKEQLDKKNNEIKEINEEMEYESERIKKLDNTDLLNEINDSLR